MFYLLDGLFGIVLYERLLSHPSKLQQSFKVISNRSLHEGNVHQVIGEQSPAESWPLAYLSLNRGVSRSVRESVLGGLNLLHQRSEFIVIGHYRLIPRLLKQVLKVASTSFRLPLLPRGPGRNLVGDDAVGSGNLMNLCENSLPESHTTTSGSPNVRIHIDHKVLQMVSGALSVTLSTIW